MDTSTLKESIRTNLGKVRERIATAALSSGRCSDDVGLVVVTKGHPIEVVRVAYEVGVRIFGENYVEEALPKMENLKRLTSIEWHMIGHIQSRKARSICEHFDIVHSIDRIKIADRLNRYSGGFGRSIRVFLECNVSGEESKSGFPVWHEEIRENFLRDLGYILGLANINVIGLMTMAPMVDTPEEARIYFQRLRHLKLLIKSIYPESNINELSMGMSSDFEVAIQEGATIVRIGQAILGPRS